MAKKEAQRPGARAVFSMVHKGELRAELKALKPRGLQKRAEKMGVDEDLLDSAEDNAATIELCIKKAVADAAEAKAAEAPAAAADPEEPKAKKAKTAAVNSEEPAKEKTEKKAKKTSQKKVKAETAPVTTAAVPSGLAAELAALLASSTEELEGVDDADAMKMLEGEHAAGRADGEISDFEDDEEGIWDQKEGDGEEEDDNDDDGEEDAVSAHAITIAA